MPPEQELLWIYANKALLEFNNLFPTGKKNIHACACMHVRARTHPNSSGLIICVIVW